MSIYLVTIQVKDGTFTEHIVLKAYIGAVAPIIVGNTTTSSNVVITSSTAGNIITGTTFMPWQLRGFKLISTGSANALLSLQGQGTITCRAIDFGASTSNHIQVLNNSTLIMAVTMAISGACANHFEIQRGGVVEMNNVAYTITNTPAMSGAFVSAGVLSLMSSTGCTFSGSMTGVRYAVSANSIVNTAGSGATYFPGNASVAVTTGGLYI